ncbi:MAG TPA: sigma-54 dependent transcriptional regulator [Verrucomicrobiae bacterium]|jgi:DNA-binding NtrC family response regulator|nr:sigma-54 dependent transcriptional regulator [Verrucomicrobiae bacterium]
MKTRLLIVDDEPLMLEIIDGVFPADQFELFSAGSGAEALDIFEKEEVDLAILDYSLPDLCGADLFHKLRAQSPGLPVIFLTGHLNLQTAVSLMKNGACDYLTKPLQCADLYSRVCQILNARNIGAAKVDEARGASATKDYIFGSSKAVHSVETQIKLLPRYSRTSVLITGPTGTGKSAVARRIHELTWGERAPLVEIDCSTIPRELCESELFGHEKGAFTGAIRAKQGLFETAGNGTAFLDEIGELEPALQVKLLRVLESRCFKRVGGHTVIPMQARVIAATNRSLPELVAKGQFREDLYFRLNVFELWMPALRERGDDILVLAQHFLDYFAPHYNKLIAGFSADALAYLQQYEFPGNVRELRNMIERAVINADGATLTASQLSVRHRLPPSGLAFESPFLPEYNAEPIEASAVDSTLNLAAIERQKLLEALAISNGNKSKAAKLVGLSRTAFHRHLQKCAA